ncbi:MAG: sulfatase-like hydrolase/transferase [Caldilinea sp.]
MNEQRPNVIFILTDDQGAWALGAAGNQEVITPNLDRLASEGLYCPNFFCASPVCSPARASILTGMAPSQHGIHDWIRSGNLPAAQCPKPFMDDTSAIEYLAGLPSYTQILADNGYVCGLSGKWHLGDSLQPQQGFSYWRVIPYGGSDYYDAPILRDGVMTIDDRYLTDVITEGALEFLEEYGQGDRPFYLSVHYTAPHSPWEQGQHPPELVDLYAGCPFATCPDEGVHPWQINSAPRGVGAKRHELLSGYYASITAVDRGVGALMAWLDAHGLREKTLVVFTGDNGMNMGHHGIWGKGNGTFPQNMYDTSVKVPFIAARAGHTPAGVVGAGLFSHYDILPTLLDYLGLGAAVPEGLPGHSFAPLLCGEEAPARDHIVVFDEYGPVRMIRTVQWKYVHRYPYGPHELYDLTADPDERHNLIDDADFGATVTELRHHLEVWFCRFANLERDGARQPVTGKGQTELVGPNGSGRIAFASDWHYIDEHGNPRQPAGA